MPEANRLTVGIMALVAEQEREAISQRTKAAPMIAELRASGINSRSSLAKALNERGVTTARGGAWTATQVARLIAAQN